jgi:hypothetical protein
MGITEATISPIEISNTSVDEMEVILSMELQEIQGKIYRGHFQPHQNRDKALLYVDQLARMLQLW